MFRRFKTTFYKINNPKFSAPTRFAVVADLHTDIPKNLITKLSSLSPDYILLPGDTFEKLDGSRTEKNENSYAFLEQASNIAPTFFSEGNHENGGIASWNKFKWAKIASISKYFTPEDVERIEKLSATFLDDRFVMYDGMAIGGLSSGLINQDQLPNLEWLQEFYALDCPKILLCHHPEYYPQYLKDAPIDLIVCGHAHGGQWRIFGRGVFAPGQGIFPKYTSGVHDGHTVISRGLRKGGRIPRFFNTPELVIIDIVK